MTTTLFTDLQPINSEEKVDQLIHRLFTEIRTAEDIARAESSGLQSIRSVRMQLYFKQVLGGRIDKWKTVQAPQPGSPKQPKLKAWCATVSKAVFLQNMLGKPLAHVAACAGVDVWNLVRVMESHGHVGKRRWTRLEAHMIPWFKRHLPDQLPNRTAPPAAQPDTAKRNMKDALPKEIHGYHASTAYGREGDYRRIIYTRSKY